MTELSYWAERYRDLLEELNPDKFRTLLDSGELESLCIQIGDATEQAYDRLVAQSLQQGESQTMAETFAESEVMREYILNAVVEENEEMGEEPEIEMDADYLIFLREEGDRPFFKDDDRDDNEV